jgi:PAS domain S-box-containing protein
MELLQGYTKPNDVSVPEAVEDLARLFEYIPEVQFWIKDSEGRFLAANRAFIGHFGLKTFREMEARTDIDLHPRPFAEEYARDDRAVLLTKRVLANKLELVSELDGSLKWYSTTKIPLKDAEGGAWGTAGFTRRLTAFPEGTGGGDGTDRMTSVVERIQKHYAENLAIPDLAALAGLSVVQFERNFRKFMKEPPSKYINKTRMRAACQLLLRTEKPIIEIARVTGFADASYFAKRFHLYLRISPTEYRRKYAIGRSATRVPQAAAAL